MTLIRCEHEEKVFEAVRIGSYDPSLQNQVSHCSICADLMLVAEFFRENSSALELKSACPMRT